MNLPTAIFLMSQSWALGHGAIPLQTTAHAKFIIEVRVTPIGWETQQFVPAVFCKDEDDCEKIAAGIRHLSVNMDRHLAVDNGYWVCTRVEPLLNVSV